MPLTFVPSRSDIMESFERSGVAPRSRREAVMGTFAQKNGHPSAAAAQGLPTCDAAYERVARQFLRQLALDHDEDFATAVAHRFKEAPAKICCRAIGAWIDERLVGFGWTQHDLADRIGVDRSAVAKWTAGGAISLGHLVSVLLEFRGDFADLPLPARRELALEGYLAALSHVRGRSIPRRVASPSTASASGASSICFPSLTGNGRSGGRTARSSRKRRTASSGGRASRSAPTPGGS